MSTVAADVRKASRSLSGNVMKNYGWGDAKPPPSCGYISPCILAVLKKLNVNRVLDLGSGNGALCGELSCAGFDAVGADYDKEGCALASRAYPKVPFYAVGVQDNPDVLLAREKIFDAVVSTEVLEHLYAPRLLPEFARRTLRDDGYLILSTPYHGYLKNLALSIFDRWDAHISPLWDGGHIKFWSRKTIADLLRATGFSVIEFLGVGRVPYLWKSMIIVAQKRRGAG